MRLEIKGSKPIQNPQAEQVIEAIQAMHGEFLTLVASDDPRAFMKISGGPEEYVLEYRDLLTQRLFHSVTPQNQDATLVAAKHYLQGKDAFKNCVPWQEVTQVPGKVDKWSDPMPEQINRGGCTTVLALCALAGGGLWLLATFC
jgi:hypothetical protein